MFSHRLSSRSSSQGCWSSSGLFARLPIRWWSIWATVEEAEARDLSVATVSSHPSQNLNLRSHHHRRGLMAIKHCSILIGGLWNEGKTGAIGRKRNQFSRWIWQPLAQQVTHGDLSLIAKSLHQLRGIDAKYVWEVMNAKVSFCECLWGGQGYPGFGCMDFIRGNKHKISLSSPLSGTDSARSSGQTAWIRNWQPRRNWC